jgi:hypothetical protein
MRKFILNKPEWSTEPEPLDFKVVNQPLEEVINQVISKLKKENRKPNNFYFLLKGLLTTNFQTYKAIRKLIKEDPKYPAQAHVLGRSLIDVLFTIVMLTENPLEYSKKYELAGYRAMWEEYDRELKRYGNDPEWKLYLDKEKKFLDDSAELFSLSEDEKVNPLKHIKYWPIPSQMLKFKMVCNEKQIFLEEIYSWRYRQSSEWSHQAWGGMAAGVFATMPEYHWHPGKFESDAVYTGILFLLMILSEIEAVCNYGFKQKLRYIWTILNNYFEEAADYYSLRYDELLQ